MGPCGYKKNGDTSVAMVHFIYQCFSMMSIGMHVAFQAHNSCKLTSYNSIHKVTYTKDHKCLYIYIYKTVYIIYCIYHIL